MTSLVSKPFADFRIVREEGRYGLCHDAGVVKTPAGRPYRLPTRALAAAIADEWRAQGDKVVPATMPLTQLAATALDIAAKDRERIVRSTAAYAATELLCHRADKPPALAARQQEVWQPLLDWCALRFKAFLNVGVGVMPVPQSPETVTALHNVVDAFDDFKLVGVSHAVDVTGSLVLGLALAEGERNAADVFKAAELDSSFQILMWGTDPVTKARFDAVRRDLDVCERWFGLLR